MWLKSRNISNLIKKAETVGKIKRCVFIGGFWHVFVQSEAI